MIKTARLTVTGIRSNNVILFTCPNCAKENAITYEMPKEFYKSSRDKTCARCKQPCTIVTQD
jgi:hypothetical protein